MSIRSPERSNVLANNVVDFGVRVFEGTTLRFPVTGRTTTYMATAGAIEGANTGFPDSVEIFVRILRAEGAQKLALFETIPRPAGYNPTESWWDIVQANSRFYTRRVDLIAKAL
ncbi:MAG: hypothetical protein K0R17_3667 [Rariglobus sp.]|nr:hypothetical protein [Rariglobus sp.]